MGFTPPCVGVTSGLRLESDERRSTELYVARRYVNAIEDAGALGVPLPINLSAEAIRALVARFDGFVLTGGNDIPPDYYGAERLPETKDLPRERVDFEIKLVHEVIAADKPLLAICFGHQLLNVALGGTLYQHLGGDFPSDLEHRSGGKARATTHPVTVTPGKLANILGEDTRDVPSSHHQCAKDVPDCCEITGRAPDGAIEAIEHRESRFVIGVQWHPELARQDPWSRRLFDAFVQKCHRP